MKEFSGFDVMGNPKYYRFIEPHTFRIMIQPAVHVVGLGAAQLVINRIPTPDQLDECFLVVGLAIVGNIKEALAHLKGEIKRNSP